MKPTQGIKSNNGQIVRKIDWHKIDKDLYKQVLSDQLDKCDFTINDPVEIDKAVTNINTAVTGALTAFVPPQKGKKTRLEDPFANLAKESIPMNFGQDYFDLVDSEYLQIIQICLDVYKHEEVTTDEFEKALHKLNRNKSADIFEKSVIVPIKTNNKVTFAEDTWSMNNKPMPIVTKTSHIGIQRDTTDSAGSTIEENLTKARRSLYSLMHTELHGENGLDPVSAISKCHSIARTLFVNIRDISRIPVRLKILTGTYILQAKRAVFNKTTPDGTCLMCKKNEETMNHFLLICEEPECIRKPLILEIISICSMLFARHKVDATFDIATIIVNLYFYCTQLNSEALISDIETKLEPLCRSLCYKLHMRRYQLLDITKKPRTVK
ncbi:unnamed protein product [Mytilus coruscus]|uniref:Reverse transcriptase zinc-binding domain-containing protein n=1 Tax=Mytilus coruscus TaxID=42192 RepID=A0A6J8EN11_MYTCO|nr:unnamed protein product [Mytilus coruscus]